MAENSIASRALINSLLGAEERKRTAHAKFTVRAEDYSLVVAIKNRALATGLKVRKREILRAGLFMLAALDDEELREILSDSL